MKTSDPIIAEIYIAVHKSGRVNVTEHAPRARDCKGRYTSRPKEYNFDQFLPGLAPRKD